MAVLYFSSVNEILGVCVWKLNKDNGAKIFPLDMGGVRVEAPKIEINRGKLNKELVKSGKTPITDIGWEFLPVAHKGILAKHTSTEIIVCDVEKLSAGE